MIKLLYIDAQADPRVDANNNRPIMLHDAGILNDNSSKNPPMFVEENYVVLTN